MTQTLRYLKSDLYNMKYDYLIVGCGLFGAVFAQKAIEAGKSVIIIDKRDHIGGNCYTEEIEGVHVHRYGAHIFHTSDEEVWEYINRFAKFNNYIHRVEAIYQGVPYSLPFNMKTFERMWGIKTPEEAKEIIQEQIKKAKVKRIKNLEDQAISLVGTDIYNILIKGYTEKQWGKPCNKLPPEIIKRIPVRFTEDDNYFNDKYQGIPIGGYTKMIEKMLKGAVVVLDAEYKDFIEKSPDIAEKIIYTGPIDEFFNYKYGHLEYRTVRFETQIHKQKAHMDRAVTNYTAADIPFTRIIDHKFFDDSTQKDYDVVTHEYPIPYVVGKTEPYYPVNNKKNNRLYKKYLRRNKNKNLYFKGRLGEYKYYDMDDTIRSALDFAKEELK